MTIRKLPTAYGPSTKTPRANRRRREREVKKSRSKKSKPAQKGCMRSPIVILLIGLISLFGSCMAQCPGNFVYDELNGRILGDTTCRDCNYDYVPRIYFENETNGKVLEMQIAVYTIDTVRFGVGRNCVYGPSLPNWGYVTHNNMLYFGHTSSIGFYSTMSSPWGMLRKTSMVTSCYASNCGWTNGNDTLMVLGKTKTWTPGVIGDTCWYDTTWVVPPCIVMGLIHEIYPQIEDTYTPPDTIRSYDLTGRDVKTTAHGLVILLLYSKERDKYFTTKIIND